MKQQRTAASICALTILLLFGRSPRLTFAQAAGESTPPNFKIAFIGDQGATSDSRSVLELIKNEGTNAVIHSGDLDYNHDPAGWESMINDILGSDFPYFAAMGNHDTKEWSVSNGYQARLVARAQRLGITVDGDYGIKSSLKYKGIFIFLGSPGDRGSGHDQYIKEKLAADKSIWSITSWHKVMEKMQVGGKSDDTGWGVYEEARKGGAIIATAHEHSYSRTYLLSSMQNQTIASKSDTLVLTKGNSFAFVSGLGGKSIRDQEINGPWWAAVYTSNQNANYGALFGQFNYNGVENLAHFYFKDIKGKIADDFWVISNVEGNITAVDEPRAGGPADYALDQNYPNPFNPQTVITFRTARAGEAELFITDVLGRRIKSLFQGPASAGSHSLTWDGTNDAGQLVASGSYVYHLKVGDQYISKRLTFVK